MIDSSNVSNPVKFFEDFFPVGFDKLYSTFFGFNIERVTGTCDEDYYEHPFYMVECNEEEGYRVIEEAAFANVNFEITQYKSYLRDELEAILKPQIDTSFKLIAREVQTRDGEGQKTYIHTILNEIEYIINNNLKEICHIKYQVQCKVYLVQYISKIVQRYSYLVNAEASYMKLLKEPMLNEFKTLLVVPHKQDIIPKLYDKLKPKFIDEETTLETFTKAFTGVQQKEGESLNIRWVLKPYGNSYLGALVVMLDYMVTVGCLGQYDDKQLSNIFVTDSGESVLPSNWSRRRIEANKDKKRGEPLVFRELKGIIDTTIR